MGDTSRGPGWWQASDGRSYRPRSAPPGYVRSGDTSETGDESRLSTTDGRGLPTDTPLAQLVQLIEAFGQSSCSPSSEEGRRTPVSSRGRLSASFGRLGLVLTGFVYLMAAALFILLAGVFIGGFLLAVLIALTALGLHRLLLLTTGRYRARRPVQWPFRPVTEMIDVVADTVMRDGTSQPS